MGRRYHAPPSLRTRAYMWGAGAQDRTGFCGNTPTFQGDTTPVALPSGRRVLGEVSMSTSGVSAPRSRQTQQQQNQDQYTVRSGDNLTTIAKRLGVPLEGLVAANPQIKDPNLIHPNQVLNVPRGQDPTGAAGGPAAGPAATAAATAAGGTQATTATGPAAAVPATPSDGYTTSNNAPPPRTARPATQPFAAIPVTDPQAQVQLQQRLQEVHAQSANSGTGNWRTREASDNGANELGHRTRNGFNVGSNSSTGMSGQRDGKSVSTSVTRSGGQTERTRVEQDRGYGRDALTLAQERSRTTRNGEVTKEHEQVSVRDRRGNQEVDSHNTSVDGNGNRTRSSSNSSTTVDGDTRRVATDRASTTTNRQGQVTSESVEEHRSRANARTGQTVGRHTTVRQNNGQLTEDVVDVHKDGKTRAAEKIAGSTEASATIAAAETRSNWVGAHTSRTEVLKDHTGVEGEFHALAVQGSASAAAGVNLKEGKLAAGAQAGGAVDLIGASGKAQLGTANSAAGQVYVKGEVHVGANARIGGGVEIDPKKLTAKVGVGGEAFAGAEIKGQAGYQNRWFGAEVEARGQAGAGVAARAEVGLDKGNLKVKADLGACVGLGGRVTVNINVNLKAIYDDTKDTVKAAAQSVANTAVNTYNAVANTVSGAVDGAKSALASGWNKLTSWF